MGGESGSCQRGSARIGSGISAAEFGPRFRPVSASIGKAIRRNYKDIGTVLQGYASLCKDTQAYARLFEILKKLVSRTAR
jgi:hypothetical protein